MLQRTPLTPQGLQRALANPGDVDHYNPLHQMNKKLKTKPIKNEQVDTRVKFSSIAFAPTPSLLLHHRHGLLTGPPSR